MRTKTTLAAAAILAAGLASSMAQNVYSLNVVGYVNVEILGAGANNLICNPLQNQTANYNTNLFNPAQLSDGTAIYTWNTGANDFDGTIATYFAEFSVWDAVVPLPVGQGFFVVNPGATFTATFVGEVPANVTRTITGAGGNNCIGASVPQGGSFLNALNGYAPNDGDSVTAWNAVGNDLGTVISTYFAEFTTWDNPQNIAPGQGFFLINQGANQNWSRNFTVAP